MKNLLLAAVCLATSFGAFAQKNAIEKYYSDFEALEEFTKVNVTSKMFELAVHIEGANEEEKELLDAISKVEGLTVIANEQAENATALFNQASKRPGSEFEELMTVDDQEAEVLFLISEDGGVIDELLIIASGEKEFAVVDIWGEIDLKQVRKMTEAFTSYGMKYYDEEMVKAAKMDVNYYPNPLREGANGTLTVPEEFTGCVLQIRDTKGNLIVDQEINQMTSDVNLSNQTAGTYIMTIRKGNVKLYTEKIVVTR